MGFSTPWPRPSGSRLRIQEGHNFGSGRRQIVDPPTLDRDLLPRTRGLLTLDPATHSAHVHGREILLTGREFGVLWLLSERPGRAVHRYELLDAVWGTSEFIDPGSVSVCVCRLRQKLPRKAVGSGGFIETVWGVGYRLTA